MRNIERNYRKNPHTANFLMTFHTAGGTNLGGGAVAEIAKDEDLLDLVPDAPADMRTPGQRRFMDDLIARITRLDPASGQAAREWTDKATAAGHWTAQRGGTASQWIDRMINKERELKAGMTVVPVQAPEAEIPAGRYAVDTDEVRCYTVDYGDAGTKWEGFLFLNRISSDDRFPIRNEGEKARILAAIREDITASAILAGLTLRKCRRCGRQLSDTKNPYFSVALGPDCGGM
jgi:hypothetical protein